jgi:hypothetical protein
LLTRPPVSGSLAARIASRLVEPEKLYQLVERALTFVRIPASQQLAQLTRAGELIGRQVRRGQRRIDLSKAGE